MSIVTLYMSIVALLGSLTYYIQAYKTFKIKQANDISRLSYLISCFTSVNWFIYGIYNKDTPLIVSGAISLIGASIVVIGTRIYK